MSDCCSTNNSSTGTTTSNDACATPAQRKRACPVDGSFATEVKVETLLHHLKAPWAQTLTEQKYYFCDNPDCAVVYFGEDGTLFSLTEIRGSVGQKQSGPDKLLCYCFGVSQGEYLRDPAIKDFVVAQTKAGSCACDSRNPSGRCCLKDFPKLAK
ncbi:MAG: hypothetical protein OEX12_05605 [Gammaproteobacteria bacterium]|nr:hypothetical protein [Gammaproteobacteria bacterium]